MPARRLKLPESLTPEVVIGRGGWDPRHARVLAIADDQDYGFALVDGNGDGAELEAEAWIRDGGTWTGAGSSGAGPLSRLGPVRTGGHIRDACFAYGSAPDSQSVTIDFDGRLHQVQVSRHAVWAFIKVRASPGGQDLPSLATWPAWGRSSLRRPAWRRHQRRANLPLPAAKPGRREHHEARLE